MFLLHLFNIRNNGIGTCVTYTDSDTTKNADTDTDARIGAVLVNRYIQPKILYQLMPRVTYQ